MGSIVNTTVPLTRIVLRTQSKVKYFIPSNMKIRNLFSFSSQKSTNTCESFQNTGSMQKRDLQSEYILKKLLGKGGFGRVFSAVRICDGLEVAVKEVLKDTRYQNDNKSKTDIPTEVALMQQVEDIEGVIKILDYIDGVVPGNPPVRHVVWRHPLHHRPRDLLVWPGLALPPVSLPGRPGPDRPMSDCRPSEENISGQYSLTRLLQPTSVETLNFVILDNVNVTHHVNFHRFIKSNDH